MASKKSVFNPISPAEAKSLAPFAKHSAWVLAAMGFGFVTLISLISLALSLLTAPRDPWSTINIVSIMTFIFNLQHLRIALASVAKKPVIGLIAFIAGQILAISILIIINFLSQNFKPGPSVAIAFNTLMLLSLASSLHKRMPDTE